MPKAPILARRGFFSYVDRTQSTLRMLDFNVVDTELGSMVEPRQVAFGIQLGNSGSTGYANIDVTDAAFNSLSQIDQNTFLSQFGTDGLQGPIEFNL